MKKLLTLLLGITLNLASFAQAPQGFNYQAVIRNTAGEIIANAEVDITINIRQGTADGTVICTETFTTETNEFGLVNLAVGSINPNDFAAIGWAEGPYFVEVQLNGSAMGVTQLLSVPYALHAMTAGETDPLLTANFDFTDAIEGDLLRHNGEKWVSVTPDFLTTLWQDGDNQVTTEVKVGIGTDTPTEMLDVDGNIRVRGRFMGEGMEVDPPESLPEEPIFVVRNSLGQIVMAVYEKGVRMYVEDDFVPGGKGNKSGFAIGGLTGNKQNDTEYFRVTPDSVRIFLREPAGKGNKGGFAIGGLTGFKADTVPLMFLAPDSTRFYIDTESSGKGNKSGFAIGGLTGFKSGAPVNFFNVSADATATIDPSEPRILWYPIKNAFLAGQVLIETPNDVGENSMSIGFETKAKGSQSQALGYKSQALGDYSTAIGREAEAHSENSFAFGQFAQAKNIESYAFGRGAFAEGLRSFAFGSQGVDSAGVTTGVAYAKGDYSFAIGQGSIAEGFGSVAIGLADTARGGFSFATGYKTSAIGYGSTAMGYKTTASGVISTAIGYGTTASEMYSTAMGFETIASGYQSFAIGLYTNASGGSSVAMGQNTIASGTLSFAIGQATNATAGLSTAMGAGTMASGWVSTAMGYSTIASGWFATSMGSYTSASGHSSTATGYWTKANGHFSTVIGSFNDTTLSSDPWGFENPIFIIGNGTFDSNRKNAMTVLRNGRVGLQDVVSPEYALELPNNSNPGVGQAIAYIWATYSDGRAKTNRSTLKYGLKEVLQLQPLNYYHHHTKLKDKKIDILSEGAMDIGLIAQDVHNIIPEAVNKPSNEETGLWSMSYEKLVPVLIKAIQEQQIQIEELRETNKDFESLKSEIEAIKASLIK